MQISSYCVDLNLVRGGEGAILGTDIVRLRGWDDGANTVGMSTERGSRSARRSARV